MIGHRLAKLEKRFDFTRLVADEIKRRIGLGPDEHLPSHLLPMAAKLFDGTGSFEELTEAVTAWRRSSSSRNSEQPGDQVSDNGPQV